MPLSFGNPFFLLGLLTVAVPIYLHLYYRKTPVKRDFPSLKLLRLANQTLLNRLKLKNWLLLALRLLVLLLLTSALARPLLNLAGGSAGAGNGAPSAFVIVLDNSLSMGATHQGIALFNAAKGKAIEILEHMGPYDKASIVLLNDPGTILFPQLTWDKSELKEAVRNAPLSMAGTSLYGSLLPAVKLLAPVKSYKRSVYLITDVTENAWKPFLEQYDLRKIDPSLDLVLVPIGGDTAPPNLAVTELALNTPLVLKNRPGTLQVTIANFSARQQKTTVSVFIDGDKKLEVPVDLTAGEKKRVTASCTFTIEGISHVRASLSGDSLTYDDSRHLAVKVLAPQRVLILRPPPDREGRETADDLFLRLALNPLNRTEGSMFQIERRLPEEAQGLSLAPYTAVFMVNARQLPEDLVRNLSNYVLGGGNLVVFPGSRTDPNWYNTHLLDNPGPQYLLPGRLVKRLGNAVSKSIVYQLTDIDLGHPAFKLFTGEDNGDPGRARIFEFFQIEPNPQALVLARLSHGLPAIIEEPRGQGRVLLVAFPADTSWSDWPFKPTFLPFLHQSVLSMIGRGGLARDNIQPGSPVSMLLREEGLTKVTLFSPDGKSHDLPIRREGPGMINVSTTDTESVGFYRLVCEWKDRTQKVGFTVNPPADESDLERFPTNRIPRFITLRARPGAGEKIGEKVVLVREGREVGMHLLWALLLIAFCELFLANRPSSSAGRST